MEKTNILDQIKEIQEVGDIRKQHESQKEKCICGQG